MADSFEVRGADDFLRLSKALKAAGETEMRKALHKGLKDAAKPMVTVAKEAAGEAFPHSGKLSKVEAKRPFRVQVKTGRDPGVSINARGRYVNLKLLNKYGFIRHPVFADARRKGDERPKEGDRRKWTWKDQKIPAGLGWFDKAIHDNAYLVLPKLERAIADMAERIAKEVKRG
jgi:hypothetical protein